MSPNPVRSALLMCGISCTLLLPTQSHAQLAQNIFIGNPKALALGNAVTADPPGIDAIHFNPAGLAKLLVSKYKKEHGL